MTQTSSLPEKSSIDPQIFTDVEAGLLEGILIEPDRVLQVRHLVKPEDFMISEHVELYKLILAAYDKGSPMDTKILIQSVEGPLRLAAINLVGCCLFRTNVPGYAKFIQEEALRRNLAYAMASNGDPIEIAGRITEMAQSRKTGSGKVFDLSSVLDVTNDGTRSTEHNGGYTGLKTGLLDIDYKLCGMDAGGLYVIGARPAMGKTALAMTVALNVALEKKRVLFFSLEMSGIQLGQRINARFGNTPIWSQKNGRGIDWKGLMDAKSKLSLLDFHVVDQSGLTAQEIVAIAKEQNQTKPVDLIVIDHLGIVAARDGRTQRVEQVAEMTRTFKTMARDLECPVILLHQLNRGVETRDDKRPTLADLRDSGSVEQDADVVMMLYREEYYLRNRQPSNEEEKANWQTKLDNATGVAEVLIEKNRQGPTARVRLRFNPDKQVFEDLPSEVTALT